MKYVTKEEFNKLLKEKVVINEKRELSIQEERDPELIQNFQFYVNELSAHYVVGKEPKKDVKKVEVKPLKKK